MRFEFATATRIVFGEGTLSGIGPIAAAMVGGHEPVRVLVVTGGTPRRAQPLLDRLIEAHVECVTFAVSGEPTTEIAQRATQQARERACRLVIGFGGGSAIDAAKAVAALLTNPGELVDYLEVIGGGRPLLHEAAPCIAIPTTAGTGAEVTRNAVLASPEHRVKVSLRSPLMLPWLALVDPELTYDLPPAITASTGLDALTQLIEAYVSINANPLTDAICREGITRAARSLARAYRDGHDTAARADMAVAGLFGGLALANAKLGAVHGFAGPLGGMFPAPHGAVCAALLPQVMEINLRALRQRSPDSRAVGRYHEIARLLTGVPDADAETGCTWIRELCAELDVPSLSRYGINTDDVPTLVEKAAVASSMKGNPITLTREELQEALTRAL